MMKRITSFKTLLCLLFMLVMGNMTAAADSKVYINDFSIAAGEEKEIDINFDTDATNITYLEATINLPEGLSFVENAYGSGSHAQGIDSRLDGFILQINPTTGKIIFVSGTGDPITGATGALAKVKVKAADNLAATSLIKISAITTKPASTVSTADAVVTCPSAIPAKNVMTADLSEISLIPGGSAEVAITLTNEVSNIQGFSAVVTLPEHVTAELVSGERGKITYQPASGALLRLGKITGNDGVLFALKLTADAEFAADGNLVIDEIALTTSDASSSIDLDPVVISLKAQTGTVYDFAASGAAAETLTKVNLNFQVNMGEGKEDRTNRDFRGYKDYAGTILPAECQVALGEEMKVDAQGLIVSQNRYFAVYGLHTGDKVTVIYSGVPEGKQPAYSVGTSVDTNAKIGGTDLVSPTSAINSGDVIEITKAGSKNYIIMSVFSGMRIEKVYIQKAALYNVTKAESITNGDIKLSATTAAAGDEVTVTATPAEGYELEAITVTGVNSNVAVEVTDGKFTMPADDVTVNATFKTATGITDINIDNNTVAGEKDVYYNLQGVRVANPGKGIYIKNGKKVLVK